MTTLTEEQMNIVAEMIKKSVKAEIKIFQEELTEVLDSWAERLEAELEMYREEEII